MRSRLAERSIKQPERSSGEPLSAGETLLAGETLFESIGGRQCLERVHGRLYEKLFAHPVLGAFFAGKDRTHQENQQTDFMSAEFGGPRRYGGRTIDGAHQHMFITEALFELRHAILAATLDECGIEPALRNRWLALDHGFKGPHLQPIAAAGGATGIRDEGLLQSAIDRPRNLFHGPCALARGPLPRL